MPNLRNTTTNVVKSFDDATAEKLVREGGWVPAGTSSNVRSEMAKAEEAAYTTTGQKLDTFGRNLISGVTGGIIQDTSEDARKADAYNPGTALAGSVASAFVPGGAPALAGKAARGLVAASGLAKVGKAVAVGAEVAADVTIQNAMTATTTALHNNRSIGEALADSFHPGEIGVLGVGAALISNRAASLGKKAGKLRTAAGELAPLEDAASAAVARAGKAADNLAGAQSKLDEAAEFARKHDNIFPDHTYRPIQEGAEEISRLAKANQKTVAQMGDQVDDALTLSRKAKERDALWAKREAEALNDPTRANNNLSQAMDDAFVQERIKYQKAMVKEYGDLAPGVDFEDWLLRKGKGHLTLEGYTQGELADVLIKHIRSRGEGLPTDLTALGDELTDVIQQAGYNIKKRAKPKLGSDDADDVLKGLVPDSHARSLGPDELAKVYRNGDLVAMADDARHLTPGRMEKLMAKMDDAEKRAFLGTLSPQARAHLALREAGLVGTMDSAKYLANFRRIGDLSEREAFLRASFRSSAPDMLTANEMAVARPGLRSGVLPRADAMSPAPFPMKPQGIDFETMHKELSGKLNMASESQAALEALKLPTKGRGLLNGTDQVLGEMEAAANRIRKVGSEEALAAVDKIESGLKGAMERYGVDVEQHIAAHDGDVWKAFRTFRGDLDNAREIARVKRNVGGYEAKQARGELMAANKEARAVSRGLDDAQKGAQELLGTPADRGNILARGSRYALSHIGSRLIPGGGLIARTLGFVGGGAIGQALGKKFAGLEHKGITAAALLAKAERMERRGELIDDLAKNYLSLLTEDRKTLAAKAFDVFDVDTKDSLRAFLPPDYNDANKTPAEMVRDVVAHNQDALHDPQSHAYEAVKPIVQTNQGLALATHDAILDKLKEIKRVLPATAYAGSPYSQRQAAKNLTPTDIDRIAVTLNAIANPADAMERMVRSNHYPAHLLRTVKNVAPATYTEYMMDVANFWHSRAPGKDKTRYEELPFRQQAQLDAFLGAGMSGTNPQGYAQFIVAIRGEDQAATDQQQASTVVGQGPQQQQNFSPSQVRAKSKSTASSVESNATRHIK